MLTVVGVSFDSLSPTMICAASTGQAGGTTLASATVNPSGRTLEWELMDNSIGATLMKSDGTTTQDAVEGNTVVAVAGNEGGTVAVEVRDPDLPSATASTKELMVVDVDFDSLSPTTICAASTGQEAGTSLATASVTPSGRELEWKLMDNEVVEATMMDADGNTSQSLLKTDSETVLVTAGDQGGTVIAQVSDPELPSCTAATKELSVIAIKKIPLGGSADLSEYTIGKVYVPTKWGGTVQASANNLEMFYTDGSDLDCQKAKKIFKGEFDANRVAQGNTCTYGVPENEHGWYYVKKTSGVSLPVSSSFVQSGKASKDPWDCPWYPMSDEQTPNLYGAGRCLDKYDSAYGSGSQDREKRNMLIGGHFVAKDTLKESDAERTWGYDFNNNDGDNDPWTGWDPNFKRNFWDSGNEKFGQDGDTNDTLDASWWGHCDMSTAVIICEDEPTGNYSAPNGVVFKAEHKKGLLVSLYHEYDHAFIEGTDVKPHVWHKYLEKRILGDEKMFGCDIFNSGSGKDTVWNYPIFEIEKAEYTQKPGQANEKVVQVKCEIKYWPGSNASVLYYWYDVTYSNVGIADSSVASGWKEHPSAPSNKKQPDTVWGPKTKTSVSSYWNNELDYGKIRAIVPEP